MRLFCALLVAAATSTLAWSVSAPSMRAEEKATPAVDDAAALGQRIDLYIERRLAEEKVEPAPQADDAMFMRRVYLDLVGKIPAVADLHEFLGDTAPDKRRKLVDKLLDSPSYIANWSNIWRTVMMPEGDSDLQVRFLMPTFEAWLRQKLTDNTRYDDMVREILTVPIDARTAMNPYQPQGGLTPVTFYQSKQLKPENIAAATSRMFLGVRIECAQCHDHPMDVWKQEQFWSYAVFFAGLERQQTGAAGVLNSIRELFDKRELMIPGKNVTVGAAYLDGTRPEEKYRTSPRLTLADWMTSKDNPYFAKTAANRLWGHFFGHGIVDPVDDFTADNPPSHPELLDELSRDFAAHNFDVKYLIRAITSSRTYQLSSRQTHPSQENLRLFGRMSLKGLTPEQIFDSVAQATGFYEVNQNRNPFAMEDNSARGEFLQMFGNSHDTRTERQTTILQALAMMNGQFVTDATSVDKSATLGAIAEFPLLSTSERIEALYLAALSRKPRSDELPRLVKYVESGGPAKDPKRALGDVFWAVLNSSEFLLNH